MEYSEDLQHVHNVMINRNLEECKIIFGHKMQLFQINTIVLCSFLAFLFPYTSTLKLNKLTF